MIVELGQSDLYEALSELLQLFDSADFHEIFEHGQLEKFLFRCNVLIFIVGIELELFENLLSEYHMVLYKNIPHLKLVDV